MTQLYSTLAEIYHMMYRNIFDYDQEFNFYDSILAVNQCHKILEIGCGSGMLARRFLDKGYDYLGLDLSHEMLEIARQEVKSDRFNQGDMRNLIFDNQFDAILITGRSIAYITDNQGIINTLNGVHKSLKDKGLFVFGVFEANRIFEEFDDFEQIMDCNNKNIKRISHLEKNLATGWTWDWFARYIIEDEEGIREVEDQTTLRAFTRDEITLFLKLTDFRIEEIICEGKALSIVARK